MPGASDPTYLRTQQYNNAANLNARIYLHARFSTNAYGWQRWLFDQLRLVPRSLVLELGCGPGNLFTFGVMRSVVGRLSIVDNPFGAQAGALQPKMPVWKPGLQRARDNCEQLPGQATCAARDGSARGDSYHETTVNSYITKDSGLFEAW